MLPRSTEIRPQVAADSSPLPSPSPLHLRARGGSPACLRGLGISELHVSVSGGVPRPYVRGERLGASRHASGEPPRRPHLCLCPALCRERASASAGAASLARARSPTARRRLSDASPASEKGCFRARAPGPAQVRARARSLARVFFEIFVPSTTLRPDAFVKVACTSLFLHFVATTPSFGSSKT